MIIFFVLTLILSGILGGMINRALVEMRPGKGSSREGAFKSQNENLVLACLVPNLRWFHAENPRGIVILLHNWSASKNRFFPLADDLAQNGYHTLLFDQRGHGERYDGRWYWIFGAAARMVKEVESLIAALSRDERFSKLDVHLLGFSVGSGVMLQVFKRNSAIKSLTCDSGPFTLNSHAIQMLVDRQILQKPTWYRHWVKLWFLIAINFPKGFDVLKNLEACRDRRLYLIENEREVFIPIEEPRKLRDSWPGPVSFWFVERAQHVMAFVVNPKEYVDRLVVFLRGHEENRLEKSRG